MNNTIARLGGTDAVMVVSKGQGVGANVSSLQPSAILPGEGVAAAVVIGQGVADLVIGKVYTTVSGQQVAPTVRILICIGTMPSLLATKINYSAKARLLSHWLPNIQLPLSNNQLLCLAKSF